MSLRDVQGMMVAVSASKDLQSQDLSHAGTVHEHTLSNQDPVDRDELYRELNRLHTDAMKEQSSEPSTTLPQSLERCRSAITQRRVEPTDPRISASIQKGNAHPSPVVFKTPKIDRWYAEVAHDQPWNPFRHKTGAISDGRNKK